VWPATLPGVYSLIAKDTTLSNCADTAIGPRVLQGPLQAVALQQNLNANEIKGSWNGSVLTFFNLPVDSIRPYIGTPAGGYYYTVPTVDIDSLSGWIRNPPIGQYFSVHYVLFSSNLPGYCRAEDSASFSGQAQAIGLVLPGLHRVSLVPNPTTGQARLEITASKAIDGRLQVVDVFGREVFAKVLHVFAGQSSEQLPAFPSGIYRVVLVGLNGKQAATLIVL
jgi:hypothetical protein